MLFFFLDNTSVSNAIEIKIVLVELVEKQVITSSVRI